MAQVLDRILAYKRKEVEAAKAALSESALRAKAEQASPVRPFGEALRARIARGGFALIAYPAEYRVSGVMTFMVNHAGAIFQKDLGPNTEVVAGRTSSFQPFNWTEVKDTALVK